MNEFVSSSGFRQLVLTLLNDEGDMRVSELAGQLGRSVSSTSRTLRELREGDLVRCVTPEKRSRVYRITDKGERALEQIPAKTAQLRARRFEMKVAKALDDAGVTYARNVKIDGEKFGGRPDFIVESSGGSRLAVELKRVSKKSAMPSVKRSAFTYNDLKRRVCELRTVLVIGGTSRQDELGREILKLESPDFFDRVFFEEELEDLLTYIKGFLKEEKPRDRTKPGGGENG